jgi:ribose transport system permease protein
MAENNKLKLEGEKITLGLRLFRISEIGIIIPLVLVILLFYLLKPVFLSGVNIRTVLNAASFPGMIAIGMTFSLIVQQANLSVGAVAGLSALTCSVLIVRMGLPIWASIIIALLAAISVGIINGFFSVKLKIPPIIVTLAMMFAVRGISFMITKGYIVYPLPDSILRFGKANPLNSSWSFVIFIILVIIFDFILRRTIIGRKIYATGADERVAIINGIDADMTKYLIHIVTTFLAGISGILFMMNSGVGSPNTGLGWEFPVIAGTIIGGVSLLGGAGTIVGAFFGILLMQSIYNGMVMVGLKAEWQNIAIGAIMIVTAGFDIYRRTRKT